VTNEAVYLRRIGSLVLLESAKFFAIIFRVDVVSNSNEFLVLVRGGQQHDGHANEVGGRNLRRRRRCGLKTRRYVRDVHFKTCISSAGVRPHLEFKAVDSNGHRTDHTRVQLLVEAFVPCGSYVDELPFDVYIINAYSVRCR
jgi:hypothetical protein